MEDRDRLLEFTKPVRLPDDCSKIRKNFTQGYFYREIGRYKNAVPSEFQWAAEDKLINKSAYEELKCQLPDYPRSTFLMVFSPDGKKVASTHGNHNVYVTDLTTGKNIQTLSGHPRTPWCIAFHPSSNQILASGCLGGQVRVWDLHGGSEVWTAESQTVIASLAFHPVDRMLVIATYNELHFWDWSQPEPFAKCSTKSEREKVRYVSFDRLGNKLITGIANPVNIPSQWDRVNVVNSQPPTTSTTTTHINSTPPTTTATTQSSTDQGRSITFCYRHLMNQYNQLVSRYFDLSRSRITPTIDRGTDPMDLLDLRSNGNNAESTATTSTSNPPTNPSSLMRFKITRSAWRSYRRLINRERLRIHSSDFRDLGNRSSSSRATTTTTTASTSVSQNSVFTTPSTTTSTPTPSSSSSSTPRVRGCAFSLGPMCLTFSPENSSNPFGTRNTSQSTSTSGAVTNPTYTSYSDRGIFSTRESTSNTSERSQFSVVRPYRLLFDACNDFRTTTPRGSQSGEGSSSRPQREQGSSLNLEQFRLRNSRGSIPHSPERLRRRESVLHSPDDIEIERELRRPTVNFYSRRQETEGTSFNQHVSPLSAESSSSTEFGRGNRSSRYLLNPVDLRNVSPVRRFREEAASDGGMTGNYRRGNSSLTHSLMHPRPVPRFQVRSRLVQDQQSQLHLITNRETHGLNLQNNQSLRRQLSFRPGGQFVLSRHSNSPFQPRVPHHIDSPVQVSSPAPKNKSPRPEIPSLGSSFTNSVSSTTTEGVTATTSSSTNTPGGNVSFGGESNPSRQLPEQINRRLFDRVKMMLRDRIRNSSENASTDSTVNYSRISGESEADTRNLIHTLLESEEGGTSRGLGPRGADPMFSSTSENADTSNDALLLPNSGNSSPVPGTANGTPSSTNGLSMSRSEVLNLWEPETDPASFSLNSPLSLNDVLNEQPPVDQESQAPETAEPNQAPSAPSESSVENSSSSPEFSMRQGIRLLSLHIENMQRLCWARIEILQLQKIRAMWEDLTNQIRHFHNIIQNRTAEEASTSNRQSNPSTSSGDVPSIRSLAISTSPVPETSGQPSTSSQSTTTPTPDSKLMSGYKELVETMVNELFSNNKLNISKKDSKESANDQKSSQSVKSSEGGFGSNIKFSSGGRPARNEAEEPQPGPSGLSTPGTSRSSLSRSTSSGVYEKLLIDPNERDRKSSKDVKRSECGGGGGVGSNVKSSSSSRPPRNEAEEPQPGPSGLSTSSTSRSSISRDENFNVRVYEQLLLDSIQKMRTEMRESGPSTSGAYQRQSHNCRIRNCPRKRFRSFRHRRHLLEFSTARSRSLNRKLEAILQTWKNDNTMARTSEPVPSTSNSESNQPPAPPSVPVSKSSNFSDACQSCGQKKKINREFTSQKRRNVDSFGSSGASGSASKAWKNNTGERSEPPIRESTGEGSGQSNTNEEAAAATSSQTQESSTNELLKQMIQTMETMLRFQREAFRRTEELTGGRSLRQQTIINSSSDDSDSDQNDANEQSELFMRNLPKNFRSAKEVIVNLMRDVTQLRAKRLLGFMVKSLTQFFGKNFSNLNQVLDEQSFSLYMLLHLALELTDLLLDQLNARSRDLERTWALDNVDVNPSSDSRSRIRVSSRIAITAARMREKTRFMMRNYGSPYSASREADGLRYRISTNPFLRSHSRLISTRPSSSGLGNTSHDRSSSTLLPNYYRRKRRPTARISPSLPPPRYSRSRMPSQPTSATSSSGMSGSINGNPSGSRYRSFRFDRRTTGSDRSNAGIPVFDFEINNNSNSSNDTNNNNNLNDDRNFSSSTNRTNGNFHNSDITNNNNNNNLLNYYFTNNTNNSNNSDNSSNNIIIVTGLNNGNDVINNSSSNNNNNNNNNTTEGRNSNSEGNTTRQSGTNTSFGSNTIPTVRSMELTLSRNESGDLSLRDERPIFWIRYGGNNETSGSSNSSDSQSRVNSFTVPVVQVNDVPVSDVSMLNQPRHRPLSPVLVPRVPEDIWRWRAWRPRFLHPRYVGPNPFDDQDSSDVPENIHYYRTGSHLGVYTLDPMIITDAPLSPHHRIQAWDFSKMNIPDISDREANGVVPECKIHNDASVDVSNDGHLLVTLLPSGRLSVTTMLGVYSLDWSSLGQLLYRTSLEQNAVSVSLSPTSRHLLVGLASRPVVVRDRTNMAQIFRLEGGRPSPHGGSWQSGRGRLVHMRDLEQTRESNIMSLNCIRWAPGAGQGLVYGTNTGQLKVLR